MVMKCLGADTGWNAPACAVHAELVHALMCCNGLRECCPGHASPCSVACAGDGTLPARVRGSAGGRCPCAGRGPRLLLPRSPHPRQVLRLRSPRAAGRPCHRRCVLRPSMGSVRASPGVEPFWSGKAHGPVQSADGTRRDARMDQAMTRLSHCRACRAALVGNVARAGGVRPGHPGQQDGTGHAARAGGPAPSPAPCAWHSLA